MTSTMQQTVSTLPTSWILDYGIPQADIRECLDKGCTRGNDRHRTEVRWIEKSGQQHITGKPRGLFRDAPKPQPGASAEGLTLEALVPLKHFDCAAPLRDEGHR